MKIFKYLIFVILILFFGYFFVASTINSNKENKIFSLIKQKISNETKSKIKKYIFPFQEIERLNKKIVKLEEKIKNNKVIFSNLEKYSRESFLEADLIKKKSLENFRYTKAKDIEYDNFLFSIYKNKENPFLSGINNIWPGSAYIDFFKEKMFIISSTGIIAFSSTIDKEIYFKQIKSNINNYLNETHFKKNHWYSVKDLKILDNTIYISITYEMKEECWNTSILTAEINFEHLDFKVLYSPNECVSKNNIDQEFNAHQSGGRIENLNDRNLIFTTGEYRNRYLAQNDNSAFGKILKINKTNGTSSLISKGHRNPQGLYFDRIKNIILSTEHGPKGGDEINLVELGSKGIKNYGWPISSYGEHYPNKDPKITKKKYEKYPLIKSHKDKGFIEPLKYFVPSIGISEILKIKKNNIYLVSSLRDKSIYFFNLENKKIKNLKKYEIGERIRDMIVNDGKIFMFLEDTASIGVLKLN